MKIFVNLNDQVSVKLTPTGANRLTLYERKMFSKAGMVRAERTSGEIYTTSLWNLIRIFSADIGAGLPNPFDIEIELKPYGTIAQLGV
jgi:hypothetical protein